MKILFINSVCGIRSTGRICSNLAQKLEAEGHECKIAYGQIDKIPEISKKYAVRIGDNFSLKVHGVQTRLFDIHGLGSVRTTKKFLSWAEEYDPQLLWLHNLHGYYINYELLFAWIKSRPQMEVKWTLHDSWAFTGHCAYFNKVGCDRWKQGCYNCPQKRKYPASIVMGNYQENFRRKKEAFNGVQNMTLITPSNWLASLVKQSFLGNYPIEVCHNTIDTSVFKPTSSDFRKRYGLENKKIILGVASGWGEHKGFGDFLKLSDILDENYHIVLVGLGKKHMKAIKHNMLGIRMTNSTTELAEIYSSADVFFNPTYEDNYPTVNLEAEACGTPVITYNTGGAPETIRNPYSKVVPTGDLRAAYCEFEKLIGEVQGSTNNSLE